MRKILTSLFIVAASAGFAQVGISEDVDFTPNTDFSGDILNDDNSPVMLDVDGRTRVRTMPVAAPNTYSPVVRDNSSGVLKILSALDEDTSKPFNVTTYSLENADQDWVRDFDTKIPTDKWTVSVTGFRFKNARTGDAFIITHRGAVRSSLANNYPTDQSGQYVNNWDQYKDNYDVSAAPSVQAFKRNGTWRLRADYPGSGTDGYQGLLFEDGDWFIDVLIIDNSFVSILGDVTVDLDGNAIGNATSSPVN